MVRATLVCENHSARSEDFLPFLLGPVTLTTHSWMVSRHVRWPKMIALLFRSLRSLSYRSVEGYVVFGFQ